MIPAGYTNALVAWATRPDLSADEKSARQSSLLNEMDALVAGQINGGKSVSSILSGSLNGKTFTWQADITAAEKLSVLTAVLDRLGLLAGDAVAPTVTYANFQSIQR